MSIRPRFALKVLDLMTSLTFYIERMGFKLANVQPEGHDEAYILDSDNYLILVAGPSVEDVASQLDEPRIVFKPGDVLDYEESDLDARRKILAAKGLTNIEVEEDAWGDRTLAVKDPNGYVFAFVQRQQCSPEEVISLYLKDVAELETVLAGLEEAQLDSTRATDEWTIR